MRRLVTKGGYQEVKTPLLFNKRLWEQSGHWGVYRENMFLVFDKEADPALPVDERLSMSLKPMNCPSHHLIYKMGKRSLPRAAASATSPSTCCTGTSSPARSAASPASASSRRTTRTST